MWKKLIDSIKLRLRSKCKVYELKQYTTYHRISESQQYNLLTKDDIRLGFGISELYRLFRNVTNNDHYHDVYDNRIGYYIDGKKINTKIHPLHSKTLVNVKNGKKYIIDTVSYRFHYGKYMTLMVREHGSRSHKQILWENISCYHNDFINDINENKSTYKLIDKVDLFNF